MTSGQTTFPYMDHDKPQNGEVVLNIPKQPKQARSSCSYVILLTFKQVFAGWVVYNFQAAKYSKKHYFDTCHKN